MPPKLSLALLVLAACLAAIVALIVPLEADAAASAKGAAGTPAAPSGLAITDVRGARARMVWSSAGSGDERISSYRVYRNGRLHRRVRGQSLRLRLSRRSQSLRVAAIGPGGKVGRKSRPVEAVKGHAAPTAPRRLRTTRVTESRVALSWSRSSKRSGRIAGYRIYRDGVLVRQVRGLRGSDANVAAATRYRYTVAAIDTQAYMSSGAGRVSVRTAKPAQSRGRAHAFLLATTDESFVDLQRNYRHIGTLYPTYFECSADGSVTGKEDPLITRWAQVRGIRVLPRFDCQRPSALHSILTDPSVRAATLSKLVALARQHRYEGINIDFEQGPASDRDMLTAFVAALAEQLDAGGKSITVEVSAKYQHTTTGRSGFYDYAALAAHADRVFVMNWGWHWATSAPGAPDDMELSRKVADYVLSMPDPSRFVLGTHLYGMDWANGGGPGNKATALEYADVQALIARYGTKPVLDPQSDAWTFAYTDAAGANHEVWYPDAGTVARRVQLARERGLGIGFWRLGREDQRIWRDPQIAPGAVWP